MLQDMYKGQDVAGLKVKTGKGARADNNGSGGEHVGERSGRISMRLFRSLFEDVPISRTPDTTGFGRFEERALDVTSVLMGAMLESLYGEEEEAQENNEDEVGGDGAKAVASWRRILSMCDDVLSSQPPPPLVLMRDRKGNLPLHIVCSDPVGALVIP